jgi:hypothetical protein
MATTHPVKPGDQPTGPVPATRGDPRSVVILAVLGGLVAMVIILWIWLG